MSQNVNNLQVVVLMRQVVPYTWLNYAASAPPEITLPWYMLASVIGQIPHNAVDVYLGGNVTGLTLFIVTVSFSQAHVLLTL